jgi:NAD(P)-dependent dehydrogenase (short-subunit alcohol dehydrogenase family)
MVAVHNRTLQSAEGTASLVRSEKDCPKAVAIEGDVTIEEKVREIIAQAVDLLGGPLDGMIVNVGDGGGAPGLNCTVEDMDRIMKLNYTSHFMFCKYAAPHLAPGSSVVLISSVGYAQSTGLIPYDASKAALEGLMRNAGAQLAPQGIRVNVLRVGIADTPMGRQANHVVPARMGVSIPLEGRLGTPWEQAYYALFLVSDDSAYGGSIRSSRASFGR